MSLCICNSMKTSDGWRHVCQVCETVYDTSMPVHHAKCHKPRGRCAFRGEEIKRVPCPTCKSRAQIAVFECEIFERCSVETNVGEHVCSVCKEFQE